jgi:hypothetical protein
LANKISNVFDDVLLYASELGLIDKEHFAVDSCKLPSSASKKWSGTHKELDEKRKKLERVTERIVQRHRERDGQERDSGDSSAESEKAPRYRKKLLKLTTSSSKRFAELELDKDVFPRAKVTVDNGLHSNVVVAAAEATGADACVADRDYRKREPAFADASRYKAHDKKKCGLRRKREREAREKTETKPFTAKDFFCDEINARCACPVGRRL